MGVPAKGNGAACMFIRKKKNKSGLISVQIIDKSSGKYQVLKTISSSSDANEVERLFNEAKQWMRDHSGQFEIDFQNERKLYSQFIKGIRQITIAGIDLLLGKIFDEIGFNQIPDDLFKPLVLSRLSFPRSKLKTTEYLYRYFGLQVHEDAVYRYLDKLYNNQKETVQRISYQHTLRILNNRLSILFYDVTTLYFEIDTEDDLRKTGFSKEGKHQNPQIVLGLLVSKDGYPLAYEIFEGNKYEGHTMLPVIELFKKKYQLEKLVIIADSGLLSNENITELQSKGYEFILGARIKNEKQSLQDKILALNLKNGQSQILEKDNSTKLIISYSESRAKKDKANRERGFRKLEKRIRSGKLTKANINNRGYNKYLKLEGEVTISLDREKFEEDNKWDGLKGYLSNTDLTKDEVIENYSHLWKIEKAFRISKNELKIRPVYHRLDRRIEAHICITFVAYKVYKELERQLKEKQSELSPERAIEIAKTIYSIKIETPLNKEILEQTLILNDEQAHLAKLFEF